MFNFKNLKAKKMIIVPVKEGENIERVLKKFKRKAEKTGIIKEVRKRKEFEKPSVAKRIKMQHAIYVNQLHREEE
jgi:small subunit ribosomal protein S21